MNPNGSGLAMASLWLLVLVPAVVGGVLSVAPRAGRAAAPVSLATAGVGVVLSVVVALERPAVSVPFVAGSSLSLEVDALSALIVPTVTGVTLLVLAFSVGDIRESRARFHGLMLLFASAAAMTATAASLPTLLMAWEVMGATSYALIGFWWRDEARVSAGLTAFLTTRTADLGLYVAAGAALAGGAGLGLADLARASDGWRQVIALGVLVAALGKAAQLPFSFWLSRAMEGPSPVSALLHSAAMVAMGGYLLLRVDPLLASTGWALTATAWVGALTAVLLGLVAVAQSDLKQLLAASTAAQLGFVVMAAGVTSVSGGVAHLIAHASTKALLFLSAGAWLTALGTKRLQGLSGVARRWRLVGWSATVGALSLAGIAPLALWSTKDAVLAAAREVSPWLYAAGMVGTGLSAAYAGKVLLVIWGTFPRGRKDDVTSRLRDEEEQGTRTVTAWQQAPLVVLAAGAATLGLLALPPLGDRLAGALGAGDRTPSTWWELTASAVLAVVVVLAVARWGVPEPRWAVNWLGLETAAHVLAVRPTLRCARALARFDDETLDCAVMAAARVPLRLARVAAHVDDRWVDGTVDAVTRQVRRFGALARRPQTGRLDQYYLQAVAVIAAAVLLLVFVR